MSWLVGALVMPEKPSSVTFTEDSFTGTAGTNLTARSGETGASWTKTTGWGGEFVITPLGRIRPSVNFAQIYASGAAPQADYDVEADFVFRDLSGTSRQTGITGRHQTGAVTHYHAEALVTAGVASWRLLKYVANTPTLLANTATFTPTLDLAYRVRLRMVGTTISLWVDGVQRLSVTDSAIATAGRAGVFAQNITGISDTAGVHLDNLVAKTQ